MGETKLTEQQFKLLFESHYESLCKMVFHLVKDRDVSEDVVQEVFVQIWLRKEQLTEITNHKAYLSKSVVFKGLDYLRKQKTDRLLKENLKIVHNQVQAPDTSLEQKELKASIDRGLDKMPDQMRTIFHLSRFTPLKNREIAEQLNISIKTVESNLSKALKILTEELGEWKKTPKFNGLFWILLGTMLNT
jgi:RNA polymerase sigma-70 factor (ECF subfamily)